jgi:hypothetical protein
LELGQDRLAIDKLSALGTGLGTATETQLNAGNDTCKTGEKIELKISLYPHRHFTEHLAGVFGKQQFENN